MDLVQQLITTAVGPKDKTQDWAKGLAQACGKQIFYDAQGHAHFVKVEAHKQRLQNLRTSLEQLTKGDDTASGKKMIAALQEDESGTQYHPADSLIILLKQAREEVTQLTTPTATFTPPTPTPTQDPPKETTPPVPKETPPQTKEPKEPTTLKLPEKKTTPPTPPPAATTLKLAPATPAEKPAEPKPEASTSTDPEPESPAPQTLRFKTPKEEN
tara:strand:+ start:4087 stop:4728 length:642 start_codon:yes stop_codon:yes gene_type:complete